jgi:hypothetical protein
MNHADDPGEACSICGRARPAVSRGEDGTGICDRCYRAPERICSSCGQLRPTKAHTDAGPLCRTCYHRERAPRPCGGCGQTRPVVLRARDGQPDLCGTCYNGPRRTCTVCGKLRTCRGVRTGRYVCLSCTPRSQDTCALCGKLTDVKTRWPLGPVCPRCYLLTKRHPAVCATCGTSRPLIGLNNHNVRICGPCAGTAQDYACATCGTSGNNYRKNQCYRCAIPSEAKTVLGEAAETFLAPVVHALQQVGNPPAAIHWLHKEDSGAATLRNLLAGGHTLTHELLDTLPNSTSTVFLRNLLVQAAVLPERDERLAATETWIRRQLETAPEHHRLVLDPYAHWVVLRRLRQRTKGIAHTSQSTTSHARLQLHCATQFLTWLDERGTSLQSATQSDVDQWTTAGATTRLRLRDFLKWTNKAKLTAGLHVPGIRDAAPATFLDQDDHVAQLTRCLTDDELPLDVRTAGALLLLYGVRVTRIVHLTPAHIRTTESGAVIDLGGDQPALLPPSLHRLLLTQAESARRYRATQPGTPRQEWLFPSTLPGRPATPGHFGHRLVGHGIDVRASRNTALVALADDLPAPVLAQILGIHIHTAERWAQVAGTNWTAYLETRINS